MAINILSSEIFNRIAAGEVINNPASVVKELLENSIDAGASSIGIEIKNGGKYIKITDNGCGISQEDLPIAFLPHATSKIKSLKDLDGIKTLGFRGEALPSVASVSKVTVISRQANSALGGKIVIENGSILENDDTGCGLGTIIVVDDLFKNVPARLKFLKSDRAEESEITSIVSRSIFANPNVSISYTVSGKSIYRSSGKDIKEAIFSVYGGNFIKEYTYIESIMSDIALYGYVSKPVYSKHNRSYQTLIVNGRYVVNADVSFWIYNCFSSYLMKKQYPAYILYLDIPFDMVDINVHPSKMDVKFVDFDRIRRLLSSAIGEMLEGATTPQEIEVAPKGKEFSLPVTSVEKSDKNLLNGKAFCENKQETVPFTKNFGSNAVFNMKPFAVSSNNVQSGNFVFNEKPSAVSDKYFAKEMNLDVDADIEKSPPFDFYESIPNYRFIGKFLNTYIFLEKDRELIIIDQHAAHERLLYDKMLAAINSSNNTTQSLLLPYIFDLSNSEYELLEKTLPQLEECGFVISQLSGNTFSISGLPLLLTNMKIENFISQFIETLSKLNINKSDFVKESIMQASCKAAVKGEMDLSEGELKSLVKQISDKKTPLFCPHGRPIVVSIKKSEIELWFKRIV